MLRGREREDQPTADSGSEGDEHVSLASGRALRKRRTIEQYDVGIEVKSPRNVYSLLLSSRKSDAALSDICARAPVRTTMLTRLRVVLVPV